MRLLSFILVISLLASCSDSDDKLVGTWKLEQIDYSAYYSEVPDDVRLFFEEQMKEEFARLKDKTFFEFQDDNKLILKAPNFERKQTITVGQWKMNDEGDSLFLDLAELENYKIEELSDTQMLLSTNETPKRSLRMTRID